MILRQGSWRHYASANWQIRLGPRFSREFYRFHLSFRVGPVVDAGFRRNNDVS